MAVGISKPLEVKAPIQPDRIILIQGNSLMAISYPAGSDYKGVLGSLYGKGSIMSLFQGQSDLLEQICFCESSFREEVCSYAGCHSGMGLCGFIPNTWNETIERMKKAEAYLPKKCDVPILSVEGFETDKCHPVFNAECNIIVAEWLLKTDGSSHWNPSKGCWGK